MDEHERLIRLEAKLDGIQTTLDVRLNHIEERIVAVATDLQNHERHEKANREAADQALKVEIDKKASREELAAIADIAKAARSAIEKVGWTVVLAVLGAVMALVLGDKVI